MDFGSCAITSLDVIPVNIPYRHPVIWAEGRLDSGDHVLVRMSTEDSLTVWTEAIPRTGLYGETQKAMMTVIRDELAPRVVGQQLWDWTLQDRLRAGITNNHVAIGAVEEAIVCLRSRHLGVHLRDLLGGGPEKVPVSWMLALASPEEMLAEAKTAHHAGYRSFKIKGGVDPDFDIELFRALSSALPDTELYIDANQGYSWRDALRVCAELAPHGLRYLEEPLPITHPNRRELSLRTGVGILGDDSVKTLADGVREMLSGSIQALSIKLPRTGVRDSMRLASMAASLGCPSSWAVRGSRQWAPSSTPTWRRPWCPTVCERLNSSTSRFSRGRSPQRFPRSRTACSRSRRSIGSRWSPTSHSRGTGWTGYEQAAPALSKSPFGGVRPSADHRHHRLTVFEDVEQAIRLRWRRASPARYQAHHRRSGPTTGRKITPGTG